MDTGKTVNLVISGKVQGVFYRVSAKEMAAALRLTGWVRNTPEGKVEIMVSGEEEQIKKYITWCWQGPAKARVDEVIISETGYQVFDDFRIER